MHYPDSRWRTHCQEKSRDDVSRRIYNYSNACLHPEMIIIMMFRKATYLVDREI